MLPPASQFGNFPRRLPLNSSTPLIKCSVSESWAIRRNSATKARNSLRGLITFGRPSVGARHRVTEPPPVLNDQLGDQLGTSASLSVAGLAHELRFLTACFPDDVTDGQQRIALAGRSASADLNRLAHLFNFSSLNPRRGGSTSGWRI